MSDIVERLSVDNLLGLPGAGILGACREAADTIESLRQQLEIAEACLAGDNALIVGLKNDIAEKDAEIERLRGIADEIQAARHVHREHNRLLTNLASIQAREQQLREVLFSLIVEGKSNSFEAQEALALPQDTTALSAMIAKAGEVMRERCAALCDRFADREMHQAECAGAIRAMLGVTLEDIK